jgi:hypothetical protein
VQDKIRKNERCTQRQAKDPTFRMACRLRSRLGKCMRKGGVTKYESTEKLRGCRCKDAVVYLQCNSRGLKLLDIGVHIDDRRPIHSFSDLNCDFTQMTINHYLNLQLLTATENLEKSDTYDHASWITSDVGQKLMALSRMWRMRRYFGDDA